MQINRPIIVASFAWLVLSFWNRNDLPGGIEFVPELLTEPKQKRTRQSSFNASYGGAEYSIDPMYEYELYGLVVSYRHHDENSRMHLLANDHLNMLDMCVVWGDNAMNRRLHNIDFWNGIFTCVIETKDREAWAAFNMQQVSNNHLLSDDEFIRDRVSDISVGDQVYFRGFLASYGDEKGKIRGTSTTRDDTGNGACETVYVREFEIIKSTTSFWRISMYTSLLILLAALFTYFRRPYRPYSGGA